MGAEARRALTRASLLLATIAACAPAMEPERRTAPGSIDAAAPRASDRASEATTPPARADDASALEEAGAPDDAARLDRDAAAPAVRFDGRFQRIGPESARFSWSGSAITARFSGTSITLRLDDITSQNPQSRRNRYTVLVDDRPPTTLVIGSRARAYPLARGLSPGVHEVTVFRSTEANIGEAVFLGFDLGDGGELLAPPAVTRRIEFIGDSITCGYGDEGEDGRCHFNARTENAFLSYAAVASRALGATPTLIAYSAIGIYRNNDGNRRETMPVRYDRTLADRAEPAWDFTAAPHPDVVVINLGTNDFAPGVPDEAGFSATYRAFVERLRALYPRAHVFCTLGPMLSDVYPHGAAILTNARRLVSGVVTALSGAGDARVHFVEFPVQSVARNGAGCDFHPSSKTHAEMAAQLAREIRAKVGW